MTQGINDIGETLAAPVTAAGSSTALPTRAGRSQQALRAPCRGSSPQTAPLDLVIGRPEFDLVEVANVDGDGIVSRLIIARHGTLARQF
jgi:hypothetical protein